MKLAILTFNQKKGKPISPGNSILFDRAKELKHDVELISVYDLQIHFSNKTRIFYKNKPLEKFDAIIVRPTFNHDPSIYSSLLRQLELNNYLIINGYLGIHRAKNKIRTLQLLNHFKLPMPKTVILFGKDQLKTSLENFTFPVIVKTVYGSGGAGVFICESRRSVQPIVEYLLANNSANYPIKIQEYIKESKGKDLRLFVVGKKVVATMERSAKKGDFRSNYHQGGKVKPVKITKKEEQLAITATKQMGLNIAGVDILRSKHGPLIVEVNSAPGLEGVTKASGVDVAGEILAYTQRRVNRHKKKLKATVNEKVTKVSEA